MAVKGKGAFKLSTKVPLMAHCENEADCKNTMHNANMYFIQNFKKGNFDLQV